MLVGEPPSPLKGRAHPDLTFQTYTLFFPIKRTPGDTKGVPMPSPSLPSRPSLEQLRKRAKDLLRAYRDRQSAALARLKAASPRYSDLSDDNLIELCLSLRDAQQVIAIEHGFADWPSMRAYIEQKERAAMIEMTVDHVRVNIPGNQRVVVLKGKEVNRYLPIWIGQAEGDAIALTLQARVSPDP